MLKKKKKHEAFHFFSPTFPDTCLSLWGSNRKDNPLQNRHKQAKIKVTTQTINIAALLFVVWACYILETRTGKNRQHIKPNYLLGCLIKSKLQWRWIVPIPTEPAKPKIPQSSLPNPCILFWLSLLELSVSPYLENVSHWTVFFF